MTANLRGGERNVLTLFLTICPTLAISLPIPARRGARSRGVADAGRGTVLRQVSQACWWEALRRPVWRRSPPKRTVRERPVGSLSQHRSSRPASRALPRLLPSARHPAPRPIPLACSLTDTHHLIGPLWHGRTGSGPTS